MNTLIEGDCGVHLHVGRGDTTTYSLRLTLLQLIVLVVQVGTDAEEKAFKDEATAEGDRIAIAHACFKRAIDTPVFLTFPDNFPAGAQHTFVIIYLEDAMLGVALAMSPAIDTDFILDFPLRHPMLHAHEQSHVIKVCIFCALEAPITWNQAITMPRRHDSEYRVNENMLAALQPHVASAFDCSYPPPLENPLSECVFHQGTARAHEHLPTPAHTCPHLPTPAHTCPQTSDHT